MEGVDKEQGFEGDRAVHQGLKQTVLKLGLLRLRWYSNGQSVELCTKLKAYLPV